MKYVAAAILATLTTPCIAQDFPPLHSRWRDPQNPGSCLEITGISEPLPGSNACVQVSGSVKKGQFRTGLVSGYACARESMINLFSGIESDNSVGPDIFLGRYSSDNITVQYCMRESNDWPPDYNCENKIKFNRVPSCDR
jgi:hypothetical protein